MSDIEQSHARDAAIVTCPCCGMAQLVEPHPAGMQSYCRRCDTKLHRPIGSMRRTYFVQATALAAIVLYPVAVTLPMLEVERFGHRSDASILSGIGTLFATGHVFVGFVVLLCSVILPLGKLVGLLIVSSRTMRIRQKHQALTYRVVEWTGRWGMLDVLLVAVLVAVLKVGDWLEVSAGPAALAFTVCVLLSLIATAAFDPHSLWATEVQSGRAADSRSK